MGNRDKKWKLNLELFTNKENGYNLGKWIMENCVEFKDNRIRMKITGKKWGWLANHSNISVYVFSLLFIY